MFNDPLQLIIETGLIGIIILFLLLIKFFVLFRRNFISLREKPILDGAYLSVICVVVSSLFSYSFQIIGILLHFLFCIAIIIQEYSMNKSFEYNGFLQKSNVIVTKITLLLTAVCLLFFGQESVKFYIKLNEAVKYSNIGYRKKAIQVYYKIADNFVQDRDVLYNYADALVKVSKIDSALIVLHKSSNYFNNDKSAILMGNLFQEKEMFSEAEKQYKKAVYINPKLFANRMVLFEFYYENQQFKKALYWGNSILKMPVKVPSKTITNIKNETRKLVVEIQNFEKAHTNKNIEV